MKAQRHPLALLLLLVGLFYILLPRVTKAQAKTFYQGSPGEKTVLALSIENVPDSAAAMQILESRAGDNALALLYQDYKQVTESAPIAVYRQGQPALYHANPAREDEYFDIDSEISSATIRGGRTGAICEDGTRSDATGRGACSHHGGVSSWLHSTRPDRSATIAIICEDYRLIAGDDVECDNILAEVKNRSY